MNKHLLIGSRALNYWFPDKCKVTTSTDWDVITYTDIPGIERHDPEMLNNAEFELFCSYANRVLYRGYWLHVVDPTGLAILKRSHLWRDFKFDKHITHYHKVLKGHHNLVDCPTFKRRLELSYKQFPQSNPALNVKVEAFFDDYVLKKYDHDYLHTLFAHESIPLYKQMQVNPTMAWCEKDLWCSFTHQQKVNCVSEECYVIATERFLVPSGWQKSPKIAYHKALNKVCTTLTSGWFRDFAIDNYPEIFDNIQLSKFQTVRSILEKE